MRKHKVRKLHIILALVILLLVLLVPSASAQGPVYNAMPRYVQQSYNGWSTAGWAVKTAYTQASYQASQINFQFGNGMGLTCIDPNACR